MTEETNPSQYDETSPLYIRAENVNCEVYREGLGDKQIKMRKRMRFWLSVGTISLLMALYGIWTLLIRWLVRKYA